MAQVEPDAATLCAGWSAHDLAIHLWQINRDPVAWPGIVVPALAGLTKQRADAVRRRWSYRDLVERLRSQSGGIACMPLDRFQDHRHALGEYYVHTQDVARPNGIGQPAVDEDLADALWLRSLAAARTMRRRLPAGLVLAHPDGRRTPIGRGDSRIIVTGPPSELLCWVYGRRSVAAVTVESA